MSQETARAFERGIAEAQRALVGQTMNLRLALVAFLSGGHILLEGVPGTAKTLMARILARLIGGTYKRIQFTPDLMPSDVVGTSVFDLSSGQFHLKRGPAFTNVLLADEINRAPAKTQSALLECMQERQVTIDGTGYPLEPPFLVLATQNPVESEGTYPLPEAELDRFFFKLIVDYPDRDEEVDVLRRHRDGFSPDRLDDLGIETVLAGETLERCRREIAEARVEDTVLGYVADLAAATRSSREILLGASPRASVGILLGARTSAVLDGRDFVTPDDVKGIALPALRHRVVLRPEAEMEGFSPDEVIRRVLETVPVPR
jgi:MoxR-like ATPase